MKPLYIFLIGAVVFGVTFLLWFLLNAFACGMNPTGCNNVSLAWHDLEALVFFIPTFTIGALMMAIGLWRMR